MVSAHSHFIMMNAAHSHLHTCIVIKSLSHSKKCLELLAVTRRTNGIYGQHSAVTVDLPLFAVTLRTDGLAQLQDKQP